MSTLQTSQIGNASATKRGVVSRVAQVIAGGKTFLDQLVAQGGVRFADSTAFSSATTTLTGAVTGSGVSSLVTSLSDGAVTLSKLANVSSGVILGRSAAGAGAVEPLTLGAGLALSSGVLSATDAGGTVTTVSVVTANGVSGTVATPGTTPAITLTLGNILPTSVQTSSVFAINGTLSSDVGVRVGLSAAAARVPASAKLVSICTGIGGTPVEVAYFQKTLGLVVGSSQVQPSGIGYFPVATYSNMFRPSSANVAGLLTDSYSGSMTGDTGIAVQVGTTPALANLHGAGRIFSVRAAIGATEVEFLRVQNPTVYGRGFVTIDSRNVTNARGLVLENQGAGVSGIAVLNAGGGVFSVGHLTSATFGIDSTNRGLYISQNSNSYDTSKLMKFEVLSGAAMASTIPAFDFATPSNMVSGALLLRVQQNLVDRLTLDQTGALHTAGNIFAGNGIAFGDATTLYNVASGFKYDSGSAEIGIFNTNNAGRLSLNLGTGAASCSGNFKAGGSLTVSGYPNSEISCSGSWLQLGTGAIPVRTGSYYQSTDADLMLSGPGRVASANTLRLASDTLGAAATDVCARIGAYVADAGVHASARLAAFSTTLNGTPVDSLYVLKGGVISEPSGQGTLTLNNTAAAKLDWAGVMSLTVNSLGTMSDGYGMLYHRSKHTDAASRYGLVINTVFAWANADAWLGRFSSANVAKLAVHASGRIDQRGVDDSASVGEATSNLPSGVNAIAAGSSSVTITNALATTTCRVRLEWYGDHGATRYWVERGAGFFTVHLSSKSINDATFGWDVGYLL